MFRKSILFFPVLVAGVLAGSFRGDVLARAAGTSGSLYDGQEEVEKSLTGGGTEREKTAALLPLRQITAGEAPKAIDAAAGGDYGALDANQKDAVEEYLRKLALRIEAEKWKDVLPLLDEYFKRQPPFDATELSMAWLNLKTEGMSVSGKAAFCADRWFGVAGAGGVERDVFLDALREMDSEDAAEPFGRAFRNARCDLNTAPGFEAVKATADVMLGNRVLTPERETLDGIAGWGARSRDSSAFA